MQMRPHWRDRNRVNQTTAEGSNSAYFTAQESAQLASTPYPLLPPIREGNQFLWLGIIDLLFAYCYDHLLTDGDPTVESAWTVPILSCTLSWLEPFDAGETIADVVSQCLRRSLIYPYLRNLDFAVFVGRQVSHILSKGGRRCVIRCLLQIRSILDQSELYYLGNKLYIDPYLAWLQDSPRHNDGYLQLLATEVDNLLDDSKCLRDRLGLSLTAIEKEAFGDGEALSSTGSSDSDSSDDEDEPTSSASSEDDTKSDPMTQDLSKDLLDSNLSEGPGGAPNAASLLVDLSRLSLNAGDGDGGQPEKQSASSKLIEELT